jgi:hypothetical protein
MKTPDGVVSRRFAVYDDAELRSIITAVSFFVPSAQPGCNGNLVFHDAAGLPVAIFAAGSWTRAEAAASAIPDAPPADMTSEVA